MGSGRARSVVRKIVADYFGSKPKHMEQRGGGLSNVVYSLEVDSAQYIIRLKPKPSRLNPFLRERWATEKAHAAGLPVPKILDVGSDPLPYMIVRKAAGEPASEHSNCLPILEELGKYAARIHRIPASGYGASASWDKFLHNEFNLERRLRILARHRMLPPAKLNQIRKILEHAGKDRQPAMNQGDLRLKNVLVNGKGRISAILDWENCSPNLAPEWDVSIALHDLSIDEKEAFIGGYGLSSRAVSAMAPVIKALNVVNYVAEVERLVKESPSRLAHYRNRLQGDLDLYSF
jgi:aminoglycoside phosphotransferase (APT) family kinase protein